MKLTITSSPKEDFDFDFPIDLVIKKFTKLFKDETEGEIFKKIKKIHKKNKEKIEDSKTILKNHWKKIEKTYIKNISEILEDIPKSKTCLVSPLFVGLADTLSGKRIFVGLYEEDILKYLLVHELIHLHYQDKIKKISLKEALKSSLMEAIDHLIFFESPLKKLMPRSFDKSKIKFIKKNKKFMDSLEKEWGERRNFKEFVNKAIEIEKKFPNIIIC